MLEFLSINTFFKTFPNLLQYHHFRVENKNNEILIYARKFANSSVETFDLKKGVSLSKSNEIPDIIPPGGLLFERQVYLYEKIVIAGLKLHIY